MLKVNCCQISSKPQTIESLTNFKALNTLRNCDVAMLKARYQGGSDIKPRRMHENSDGSKAHWHWAQKNESSNFGYSLATFMR
jgi:hypothetical protein